MTKFLKEIGTVSMTLEALDKIEKLLDRQIKKEKARIESWDADQMIFDIKQGI